MMPARTARFALKFVLKFVLRFVLKPVSTVCLAFVATSARGDAQPRRPVVRARATGVSIALRSSLDVWIVERFRGAGLLPDSTTPGIPGTRGASIARIEGIRAGATSDTVFALHFTARPGGAALQNGESVRLAGPTGTIAPISGIVLVRRAFRAPRVPQAGGSSASGDGVDADGWRYGWAYLVSLPRAGRTTPVTTFRGWMLVSGSAVK